jgi:hypothetical protein
MNPCRKSLICSNGGECRTIGDAGGCCGGRRAADARVHAGALQHAVAQRDAQGHWQLRAWQIGDGDLTVHWSARPASGGYELSAIEIR